VKHDEFIIKYCEILDQTHGQRPDILWFSTWMASKAPYFEFAKNFESFCVSKTAPTDPGVSKKIRWIARLSVTLTSLILKAWILKFIYRDELEALYKLKKINVIRTFLYSPLASEKDPFWGDLVPLLATQPIPLVTLFEPQFSIFECKKSYSSTKRNFPYHVFIDPLKLFRNFFLLVKESFQHLHYSGQFPSENQNLSKLLTATYQKELLAPAALVNLVFYDVFTHLMKHFEIEKLYIPFENNPWEKMCYIARKDLKMSFSVVGFQHATVQQDATNYFLSKYEAHFRLHPDIVMCVGKVTFDLLRSYPFYETTPIKIGCALRHSNLSSTKVKNDLARKAVDNLLVVLDGIPGTIRLVELILSFIEFQQTPDIEIRLKEHPNFKLSQFYPEVLKHRFFQNSSIKMASGSLEENLSWCDVLMYSGTTVSLEALELGKPILQYNQGAFNYDPVFQLKENKLSIVDSEGLKKAILALRSRTTEERIQQSRAGKSFVESYFYPCTKESLERFLHT
jgi:hypothetical protein